MQLTEKLKSWLTEHQLVTDAASEEEMKQAVLDALTSGKLTPAKFAELTAQDEPEEDDLTRIVNEAVSRAVAPLVAATAERETKAAEAMAKSIADRIEQATRQPVEPAKASQKAAEMFGQAAEAKPRVKLAIEQYDSTKTAAYHSPDSKAYPTRGGPQKPAMIGERHLDHPSKADLAVCGAWFKRMIAKTTPQEMIPGRLRMTDHDKDLCQWAVRNMEFSDTMEGSPFDLHNRKLADFEQKALLDENVSGGDQAVPTPFDEAVIITPVLYGEVFPLVDVRTLPRGAQVDGFAIGNPTVGHTAEGSAITPFNTAGMITAFDTTIFPAVGAIELGIDFMSDSPVDLGALVTRLFGEKYMEWLDNQIVNGDGTTEPTGVLLAGSESGTDIGNPAGGDGAAAQVDDYEALMFGVGKEYQPPQDRQRCAFISNLTSYRRCRAIAVGAADERRVFGMDHRGYMILDAPFKIQNNLANSRCGYYNFRYYVMYRRLGMTVRVETAGSTLALANKVLIVCRQRWGGKLSLSGAGAYSDNWQA